MKLTPHQRFMKDASAFREKMLEMRKTMRDADIARKFGITRQAVNSALGPRKQKEQSDWSCSSAYITNQPRTYSGSSRGIRLLVRRWWTGSCVCVWREGSGLTMLIDCPTCYRTMTKKGKDRLMRSHARELRKRDWVCECGTKLKTVERRYPCDPFVMHRKVLQKSPSQ